MPGRISLSWYCWSCTQSSHTTQFQPARCTQTSLGKVALVRGGGRRAGALGFLPLSLLDVNLCLQVWELSCNNKVKSGSPRMVEQEGRRRGLGRFRELPALAPGSESTRPSLSETLSGYVQLDIITPILQTQELRLREKK